MNSFIASMNNLEKTENGENCYNSLDNPLVELFFKTQKMFDNLRNQNLFNIINHFEELADKFGITKW